MDQVKHAIAWPQRRDLVLIMRSVKVVPATAIPLARMDEGSSPIRRLNPRVDIAGEPLVLETLSIGSYEPVNLRRPVANLQVKAAEIRDALEFALHGF